jgi:peroxiredoxin
MLAGATNNRRIQAVLGAVSIALFACLFCGAKQPTPVVAGIDGKPISIEAPEKGVTVLVCLWSECPISNQYAPVLNELAASWRDRPVRLVGVYVDPLKSPSELKAHAEEYGLRFPLGIDPAGELCRHFGVDKVPMALVVDERGVVQYQGRIDDRFASIGHKSQKPTNPDLAIAVAALLDGRRVEKPNTPVVGCTTPGWIDQPNQRAESNR